MWDPLFADTLKGPLKSSSKSNGLGSVLSLKIVSFALGHRFEDLMGPDSWFRCLKRVPRCDGGVEKKLGSEPSRSSTDDFCLMSSRKATAFFRCSGKAPFQVVVDNCPVGPSFLPWGRETRLI